ncbi:hypothetical protein MNEG_4428, partial [Monoraphidium neglectum]
MLRVEPLNIGVSLGPENLGPAPGTAAAAGAVPVGLAPAVTGQPVAHAAEQ